MSAERDDRMSGPKDGVDRRRLLGGALAAGGAAATAGLWLPGGVAAAPARQQAAEKPRRGGHLRIAMNDGGPQETLNPLYLPTFMETMRASLLYERLFQQQADGSYKPWLAQSMEPNRNATVWKLTLKPGIEFHDGSPLTAEDVLSTFGWILDAKSKSEAVGDLEPIDLRHSKVRSKRVLEIHLKAPVGDLDRILAGKAVLIVPKGKRSGWNKENGTGPFKLVSFSAGRQTVLARNPHYWGSGPWVDQLTLVTIADPGQRLNALTTGQVDYMASLDFVQAKSQASNAKIHVVNTPGSTTVPFYMQIDAAPFKDNRVREAFKLAIDREALVKNVLLGFGTVGNDLYGKGYPSYDSALPQRKYDPEKAKSLLAAAGQPNPTVTLYTAPALPGQLEAATVYKQQARAAGINIDLQKIPADSYWSNDKYLKVPFYQTNFSGPFESIATQAFVRNAPYNETHWYDARWDAQFRQAQGTANDARRYALYRKLEAQLWKEGGYIIWGFQNLVDAASPKVKGITRYNWVVFAGGNPKDWWLG